MEEKNKFSDFKVALPIAFLIIGFFIFLQKIGIMNLISTKDIGFGTVFVIGLVASVSSCMAIVGGLVLSISANFSKEGEYNTKPQVYFHLGRLASFFIFGGIIGLLGATFQLNIATTFILNLIIAVVLMVLGINLLGIFPWIKKIQPKIPNFVSEKIHNIKNINHTLTPLILGFATFFLPCGFTQSMQIYTLSTGNFWTGALTMLVFCLGTLPVLALLSFGSIAIHKKNQIEIFLKTAGLVVIFFAIFSLISNLNTIGVRLPSFNKNLEITNNVKVVGGIQIIELEVRGGYSPQHSAAKANLPTVLILNTKNTFDCSLSIRIPDLNYNKFLPQTGKTEIDLGVSKPGLLKGSCGMGMYLFEVDFQ